MKEPGREVRSALQASRFADADEFSHEEAEVEACDVDEYAFEDVAVASQVSATHRAGLERVHEGALEKLAAATEQRLASIASNSTSVAVDRIAFGLLVLPVPASALRLRHVAADLELFERGQYFVAVIALVGNDLVDLHGDSSCLWARCVRPSVIFMICASGSFGLTQASFEPFFGGLRSTRAISCRVGVSTPQRVVAAAAQTPFTTGY
jgi:hypothetical protein